MTGADEALRLETERFARAVDAQIEILRARGLWPEDGEEFEPGRHATASDVLLDARVILNRALPVGRRQPERPKRSPLLPRKQESKDEVLPDDDRLLPEYRNLSNEDWERVRRRSP